jgi:hypothetical protein
MGKKIIDVLSGVGILIAVGIVIWNYRGAVSIIDSLGSTSIQGIKTLQGRA